jgi:hypothetical protein
MARALGVHLPLSSPLLLAIGTWLVYVADRILDGLLAGSSSSLRERHFFYARHRRAFLIAAIPAGLLLLWLILTRMNRAARHEDVAVFGVALLYFCAIHAHGPAAERWLPKELAVGVVFAVATAVPAWSRLPLAQDVRMDGPGGCRPVLALMVLFLAALCWLNCVAIEKWERKGDGGRVLGAQLRLAGESSGPHRTTLWAQRHLRALTGGLALAATLAAGAALLTGPYSASLAIFLACAVTGVCLLALDHQHASLSAFSLRIAADAAMLSPVLFLAMLR